MDKRQARSEQSVRALFKLLQDVAREPGVHVNYSGLREALGRQGHIAKYEVESLGIRPVSLNTLKRVADDVLGSDGGFQELDSLRRIALSRIEQFTTASLQVQRDTRDGLRLKLKQAKARNRVLREDLAFLSDRLMTALNLAERCASTADSVTQMTFKRQRAEILTSLGLRRTLSPNDTADDDLEPRS